MERTLAPHQWPPTAIASALRIHTIARLHLRHVRWGSALSVRLFMPSFVSSDFQSRSRSDPRPIEGRHETRTQQERASFEQLFTDHSPALFEYLCGMARGDRELAADLVQETFLRAYRAQVALTEVEHPHAWLFRIATNLALTTRRRRTISWLSLDMVEPLAGANSSSQWRIPPALVDSLPDIALLVSERDAISRVLTELPPQWRAVLLLQTTSGFTAREIASLLRLSEANTRKILFRAKERFRAIYRTLEAHSQQQGGSA